MTTIDKLRIDLKEKALKAKREGNRDLARGIVDTKYEYETVIRNMEKIFVLTVKHKDVLIEEVEKYKSELNLKNKLLDSAIDLISSMKEKIKRLEENYNESESNGG